MTDEKGTNRSSMDWWVSYPDNPEPVSLTKEDIPEYQSDYVRYLNLITDRGWKKVDRFWVSPCGKYKYNNVYSAYRCQMFNEMVDKK